MSGELKQREWFVKGWNSAGTVHFDLHILGGNITDVLESIASSPFKGGYIYHMSTTKPKGNEVAL